MDNSEETIEKPLSPVLNSHRINRKLLLQKKLQRKSNRVQLVDRFQSSANNQNFTESVNNNSVDKSLIDIRDGFQTASGRIIQLSDGSLEKCTKLFADILNPIDDSEKPPKSDAEPKNDFLDLYNDDSDKLFENITIIENEIRNNKGNFQPNPGDELKLTQSVINSVTKRDSEEFSKLPGEHNKTTSFGGFQTASGKGVKLSEAALEAAKKRFNEDLSNCSQTQTVTEKCPKSLEETTFVGFKSASGKDLKLSESSLEHAKKRFSEEQSKISEFDEKAKFGGFQTASGKGLKLSQAAIDAAERRFNEDLSKMPQIQNVVVDTNSKSLQSQLTTSATEAGSCFANAKIANVGGFQTASGKGLKLSQAAIDAAERRFSEDLSKMPQIQNVVVDTNSKSLQSQLTTSATEAGSCFANAKTSNVGGFFQTASGKGLKLSKSAIEAAERRFSEDFSNCPKIPEKRPKLSKPSNEESSKLYSENNKETGFSGVESASGRNLKLADSSLETARRRFSEALSKVPKFDGGFQTASGKGLRLSASAIETAEKRFNEDFSKIPAEIPSVIKDDLKPQITTTETDADSCFQTPKIANVARRTVKLPAIVKNVAKKRIGENLENSNSPKSPDDLKFAGFHNEEIIESQQYLRNFKQIAIDNNKRKCSFNSSQPSKILKTSTSLINTTVKTNRNRKRLGMSIKLKPVIEEKLARARLIFDDLSPIKTNRYDCFNSTPVKTTIPSERETPVLFNSTITPIKSNVKQDKVIGDCSKFVIEQHTGGNFDVWTSNLEKQRLDLENQLRIIVAKQEALNFQRSVQNNADSFYKQKRQGVLLSRKQMATRVSLKDLKIRTNGLEKVPIVTPQNAAFIHFRNDSATIKTEDGAMIVPNIDNLIGFTEISNAFKTMPGIEPKLIPKLWLENHYKWIVWKLASYENCFEDYQDFLNVENIIQQLKYRYDREIDKAERSILRRILEKDDTPQKRMVLCVANIIKLSDGKFELELTDGWYSVKTVTDEILSLQILKNKIQIGTKLMINSAELLNCDGCHPLETPDCVYLKINSNATRRTLWHCKLGCYHIAEPFPISLRSIQPSGGLIGCIKVYIARIYPIRYLEKQGKMRVWRNQRGEERRAQEWENEKLKRIEQIHELVRKDYEKSLMNSNKSSTTLVQNQSDILEITCGRTLFHLYENSKDPERFQELLSPSQRDLMIDFQRSFSFNKQQEINHKIKENINKLDICQRDVTAVLKILVVDTIETNDKGFIFQIWKADEHHLQTLTEGSIFRIYNVMPKINGDLSSTTKTRFKQENDNLERFNKLNRALIPISTLLKSKSIQPCFNEFDTVGIIVQLSINQYDQDFWLCDTNNNNNNNSCMVFVKIFENPKNCSLLDNLKIGDIIAISNLIYCEKQYDLIRTIANHSTIISKYPQSKHLIDGIDKLNRKLSTKNIEEFLADCKEKVSYHLDKISIVRNSKDVPKSLITDANLIEASGSWIEEAEESTLTSKITSLDVAMSMIDLDKFT